MMTAATGSMVSGPLQGKVEGGAVRIPEFSERVREAVRSGGGEITLQVHPPALGPVHVTVRVDPRSKTVEVHLGVKDASVRKVLEGKEVDLRQLLQNEGFSMNKLDVSVGTQSAGTGAFAVQSPSPSSPDPPSGGSGGQTGGSGSFSSDFSGGGGTLFSGESRGGQGSEARTPMGEAPGVLGVGPGDLSSAPTSLGGEDGRYHRIA